MLPPNDRIHAPAHTRFIRGTLARVACNPLLDRLPILLPDARLASSGFSKQDSTLLSREACLTPELTGEQSTLKIKGKLIASPVE
jgi:hypothetical protein